MSIKEAMKFDRHHILLSNASHAALGFGIAVLLQDYLAGNAFFPVVIAWILVIFGLVAHVRAWTSKRG